MFAVVKTGGKQYKVAENDIIKVERLPGDAGSAVTLDQVLAVGDDKGVKVGSPLVAGTVVSAEIVEQTRGDKIIVFKKKRRKNYRRTRGHRQELTVLRITGIGGARKAAPKKAAAKPAEEAKPAPKPEAKTQAKAETKTAAKPAAKPAAKTPAKKPAAQTTAKTAAKPAAKAPAKKPAAKAAADKPAAAKSTAKKAPAKKPAPKAEDTKSDE